MSAARSVADATRLWWSSHLHALRASSSRIFALSSRSLRRSVAMSVSSPARDIAALFGPSGRTEVDASTAAASHGAAWESRG